MLEEENIKLVGIGHELLGIEEFIRKNYFSGRIYIDSTKECYKYLGYKR